MLCDADEPGSGFCSAAGVVVVLCHDCNGEGGVAEGCLSLLALWCRWCWFFAVHWRLL
jgi:hypothetical protein